MTRHAVTLSSVLSSDRGYGNVCVAQEVVRLLEAAKSVRQACYAAPCRLVHLESHKDSAVPYKDSQEMGYTAIRRLRCPSRVFYGYWRQWHATGRCYTADGRTILSSACAWAKVSLPFATW